jgi:uncharacterized SAM-dependent methyltransferase
MGKGEHTVKMKKFSPQQLADKRHEGLLDAFISFLSGSPNADFYPFTYCLDELMPATESCMGQWDGVLGAVDKTCKYYIFPNEVDLISRAAPEIATYIPNNKILIELGIGSRKSVIGKTLPLLRAIHPRRFIINDLSESSLLDAETIVKDRFPYMDVVTCQADYLDPETPLQAHAGANVLFTGSTISNILHYDGHIPVNEVVKYLKRMGALIGDTGRLIITQDTNQDEESLKAAYRTPSLVKYTMELLYLMQEHPAVQGFDPSALAYEPVWKPESHLLAETFISTRAQDIKVGATKIRVPAGGRMHVSNSYRYPARDFFHMAYIAGLEPVRTWMDKDSRVALHVLTKRS